MVTSEGESHRVLFDIYINDNMDEGVENHLLKFADDTTLFSHVMWECRETKRSDYPKWVELCMVNDLKYRYTICNKTMFGQLIRQTQC